MDIFPLRLFPPGGLSQSVITTVWVGVLVSSFFNLRLGWPYSGLIVPGYLVPLFIAKPWSALLICAEGLVTYLLVQLISEAPAYARSWSGFFGRDRFFLLLLVSVAVRVAVDGVVAPWIGAQVQERLHMEFDYRNNLHSYGLIIVSLVANQFWATGLRRGLFPWTVVLGITYVLVRYVLMEWTNFSIGNLEYLYEDTAISLLASPKAYIILIIAAFFASRMNLHYGWEFNGILIPSLLALLCYQPTKILTSFGEAAIVFVLGSLALRLPMLKGSTVEGARKVLLFFNISFAYKMALGFLLVAYGTHVKVTDFYGFGYLLATLMAIRAHDKGIAARLTRATLQVAVTAAVLASVLGFALTFLPMAWLENWLAAGPMASGRSVAGVRLSDKRLIDVIRKEKVVLYRKRVPDSVPVPMEHDMESFSEGVRQLMAHVKGRDPSRLGRARAVLDSVNYRVDEVQDRYLLLRENAPQRGWGLFALDTRTPSGLLVEVPAPIDEWGVMEAGTLLFQELQGSALAMAGAGQKTNREGSSDVLTQPRSFFNAFHKVLARRNVLQVRGYTAETIQATSGARAEPEDIDLPETDSVLWVKSAVPPSLNLAALQQLTGRHAIMWGRAPWHNLPRDGTWSGFAELMLNRADCRTLLVRSMLEGRGLEPQLHLQRIDGYLQDSLLGAKARIAGAGTDLYRPPTQEDLLFLDEAVLTPLLKRVLPAFRDGQFTPVGEAEMKTVIAAASVFDYRILWYRHQKSAQDFLILDEQEDPPQRRYWGAYVFRLGPPSPFLVQVPRPIFDQNSFEYGVALFDRLQAGALLIAGATPRANRDGSADLVRTENKLSLFNLVNQVLLRESGDRPLMAVQSRAFGQQTYEALRPPPDVLLAIADGTLAKRSLGRLGQALINVLEADRLRVQFVDGSPGTMGYEVGGTSQAQYLPQTTYKEFAILWLSPIARSSYRQQTENKVQESQFRALEIPTVQADLVQHLREAGARERSGPAPDALRELVGRYHVNQDIVALHAIRDRWPAWRLERIMDRDSRQAFLLIGADPARLPWVVNLAPRPEDRATRIVSERPAPEVIQRFIDARAAWLEFREGP